MRSKLCGFDRWPAEREGLNVPGRVWSGGHLLRAQAGTGSPRSSLLAVNVRSRGEVLQPCYFSNLLVFLRFQCSYVSAYCARPCSVIPGSDEMWPRHRTRPPSTAITFPVRVALTPLDTRIPSIPSSRPEDQCTSYVSPSMSIFRLH